jgi:hypothetical protein
LHIFQIWYGHGGLLDSIGNKAHERIEAAYGIPGNLDKDQITDRVRWLLSKGHFKFGGIDYEVCFCYISELNAK